MWGAIHLDILTLLVCLDMTSFLVYQKNSGIGFTDKLSALVTQT
jgi:hypothetical protein